MASLDLDNDMKQDVKISEGVESLDDFRSSAMSCFESLGLPNKRMERWKYTDLTRKLYGYDPQPLVGDCRASLATTSKGALEALNEDSLKGALEASDEDSLATTVPQPLAGDCRASLATTTTTAESHQDSSVAPPSSLRAKRGNLLPDIGLKNSVKLYFQNGIWQKDLTDTKTIPDGVVIKSLSSVIASNPTKVLNKFKELDHSSEPMLALNQAEVFDGIELDIQQDLILDDPIEFIYLNNNEAFKNKDKTCQVANYRHIINIAKGANVKIVEHVDSSFSTPSEKAIAHPKNILLNNIVWQIDLAEAARLDYLHYGKRHASPIDDLANANALVHYVKVNQAKDSVFTAFSADFNANFNNILQRFDINVDLNESGARCQLNGVYTLSSKAHSDHHTRVNHLADNTISGEHYNGVLSDKSIGVFNGQVKAFNGTKGVEAHQLNHNLLLTPGATIFTKPQLEIETDDVQCSHGASVGELDETSMFYLSSRGIDRETAKLMLTQAFLMKPVVHADFTCWSEFVTGLLLKAIKGHFWCQKGV